MTNNDLCVTHVGQKLKILKFKVKFVKHYYTAIKKHRGRNYVEIGGHSRKFTPLLCKV